MSGRKTRNVIAWCVLAVSVFVMAAACYKFWEGEQVYREGDEIYERLAGVVRLDAGSVSPPDETPSPQDAQEAPQPQIEIPYINIDFSALKSINEDATAWLYCPDTVIDYPVMRADDYNRYLYYLPDGTYNANGSLFIDYNNPPDFSGRLTVIYGHNMKSGKMFGSITGYKRQSYFDDHPYLYIYTEDENYRIDLIYGCLVGAGEWRDRAFVFEANLDSLLAFAAHNTTFESDVTYGENDRFVVLSTCSYEFDDARYVVIGVLRAERTV